MICEYSETTFEEIYDLWNEGLWPNRVSKIESRSSLSWDAELWEGYGNISITKQKDTIWKYEPTFWAAKSDGKLIGVNSGFKTNDNIYRSRGLYVSPEHRGHRVSNMLFKTYYK